MKLGKLKVLSSILFISLLLTASAISSGESYIAKNLAAAQFTTLVKEREPVDNINAVDTSASSVYFFVDVRDCKGCVVEHEWWYRGAKVSTIKASKIKYDRYRWWSKKTLVKDYLGDWTVKVVINGKVRLTKTITYGKTSTKQIPIKNRVFMEEASECELQLRYFSTQSKQNPEDGYFKFMLDKWTKRCLPE